MTRTIRCAGLFVAAGAAYYVPWLLTSINRQSLWLSIPFVLANLLVVATVLVTVINNWHRSVPPRRLVVKGTEPEVAVIVPTCGEPGPMLERTLTSIIEQDWPAERLLVILSDDARSAQAASAALTVMERFPETTLRYHHPPGRSDPSRRGEAKAGNLNSALDLVRDDHPFVRFVETRDADDEVGDRHFLREAVGQLIADEEVAFVQTIKEAHVSPGDPFGNLDPLFYRGAMMARNAANAVFPCGSGLVWRLAALEDIDGFPSWNLVEDLQSGVEALRRGWRGIYVPIVGAVGQVAPEDIPNVYKQRGTWALDTVRLLLYGRLRGLSLRQRLHFVELGLFYVQSLATLVFLICPVIALALGVYPLVTTHSSYVLHFWPFALGVELFLAALCAGQRYEALWRARQLWVGLAPVYAKACLMALLGGPSRKPVYRVTRKDRQVAWYWRQTLPQTGIVALLLVSLAYALTTTSLLDALDVGSMYWAGFSAVFLLGFIRKSWLGVTRDMLLKRAAPVDSSPPRTRERKPEHAAQA